MLAWVVDCRRDCRDLLVEGRVCESLRGTRLGQPPSICCEFHNLTIFFWGGGGDYQASCGSIESLFAGRELAILQNDVFRDRLSWAKLIGPLPERLQSPAEASSGVLIGRSFIVETGVP